MANLPRFGRTWQRFSSLPRPGTASRPEVQPTTEPEVFPYAPTTTNILQTSPIRERSSPVRKFPSSPSSPKYRATAISPPKPLSPTPTYNRYNGERRTSATSSPKTFKSTTHISPPPSPAKHKYSATTIAAPLSPLTLPRLEVRRESEHTVRSRSPPEVQQKTILHQKPIEKPTKTEHQPSEYSSGKPHQKHQHQHQQQSDVINIKGENIGAVMHITHSSDHGTEIHKKKPSSTTTTTLGHSSNNENEDQKGNKSSSSNNFPGKSFMNSNFQGVNNSILYNSSLSHRDPGLHLSFSNKPNKNNHGDSLHESRH